MTAAHADAGAARCSSALEYVLSVRADILGVLERLSRRTYRHPQTRGAGAPAISVQASQLNTDTFNASLVHACPPLNTPTQVEVNRGLMAPEPKEWP